MSAPIRKSTRKSPKPRAQGNINAFTRDEILAGDVRMAGKRFHTPAPILTRITTKYRAAS